eukprot:1567377-Pyramimonas_sp.AAC.1
MEGGWCSKCGFRKKRRAHLFQNVQELQGWRVGRFQNVALALAQRAFFKQQLQELQGLKACGSRFSAAHIRSQKLQGFHGLRACRFQIVVLALAQRTFVSNSGKDFAD